MATAQIQYEELRSVDRIWHLKQTPLFAGLSASDLRAVASACPDRVYSKGEVIFEQGDPARALFILNRGCVLVSVINSEDREKIFGIYTTGDIFGENMLEPQEHFPIRATAHEECWVSIISRDQFLRLIEQRAGIAVNYIRILSQRLFEAREDIEAHSFLDTEHRLAKALLKLTQEHGKEIVGRKNVMKLKFPLSHEHLARLIGGNRPHVSMIMSKFKKCGWINYQARKLLIDVDQLEHRFATLNQENGTSEISPG